RAGADPRDGCRIESPAVRHASFPNAVTRQDLVRWFRSGRALSKRVFSIPKPEAYYDRPIPLRNPIVFYEGHIPAFAVNTLIKLALKHEGIDGHFETLFARGIDPEDEHAAKTPTDFWPPRDDIQAYGREADDLILRALCDGPIDDGAVPQRRNAEAAIGIAEHEPRHTEKQMYRL